MERIAYIDLAKFIAITLVCIGHVNSYNWGGLHHVIYSFHMPLFMFMSGLFFRVKPNLSVKELIIKRAKTLLLPAITVSILSILIMTFYGDMTLRKAAIEFYGCAWFLKCLFLCYIIVWLSMTVLKNVWLAFFVSEIFLLFVPHGYVFGLIFLIISGNIKMVKKKALEHIFGQINQNMKENGKIIV